MEGPWLQDLSLVSVRNLSFPDEPEGRKMRVPEGFSVRTFFSIHDAKDALLYVSEVALAYSSAHFGTITVPFLGGKVLRVRIKLWAATHTNYTDFRLLHMALVDLPTLKRLKGVQSDLRDAQLAPNALIWAFGDDIYAIDSDLRDCSQFEAIGVFRKHAERKSYTFDDLRQINSLVQGVREYFDIKSSLLDEIDSVIAAMENGKQHSISPEAFPTRLKLLEKMTLQQKSAREALSHSIRKTEREIKEQQSITEEDFPKYRDLIAEQGEISTGKLPAIFEPLKASVYPNTLSSTRELVEIVMDAIPIEAVGVTGRFAILSIELPPSIKEILHLCYSQEASVGSDDEFLRKDPQLSPKAVEFINAALSQIVFLGNILADIVGVRLKYSMNYAGSRSTLREDFSPQQIIFNGTEQKPDVPTSVIYPLFFDISDTEKPSTGGNAGYDVNHPRFERALELLKRNISDLILQASDLMTQYHSADALLSSTIPPDCSDNFLWNLQYLMLLLTAPTT